MYTFEQAMDRYVIIFKHHEGTCALFPKTGELVVSVIKTVSLDRKHVKCDCYKSFNQISRAGATGRSEIVLLKLLPRSGGPSKIHAFSDDSYLRAKNCQRCVLAG
jgi:hypothetical protein